MKTTLLATLLLVGLFPNLVLAERLSLSSLQAQINLLTQMVQATNAELAQARNDLAAAQAELTAIKSNTVLQLDGIATLSRDAGGNQTVLFNGTNLQLVNGTGVTDTANGLGNLVIGYNTSNAVFVDRLGSHNAILGDEQSYPDTGAVVTANLRSDQNLALVVANDMSTVVGGDQNTTVTSNRNILVSKSDTTAIGGSASTTVGANKTITIGVNKTENIGANKAITIGANKTENIGGDKSETIGSASNTTIAADKTENVGGFSSMAVAQDLAMNIGKNMNAIVGQDFSLDAVDQLFYKSGKASSLFKKDGAIQIKGKDITLEGSGAINVKATGNVVIKGSQILQN